MNYVSRWSRGFRIPRRMLRWLEERTAGEMYQVQAIEVAGLIMRYWASPKHIGKDFPLSRRDLMELLDMRENHVRRAIDLLVAVGFIRIEKRTGKARRTGEGIRKPPRLFQLAAWILSYFRRLIAVRSGAAPISNPPGEKILSSEKESPRTPRRILIGAKPPTPVLSRPKEDDPKLMEALMRLGLNFA